jgi:hypothetical protein
MTMKRTLLAAIGFCLAVTINYEAANAAGNFANRQALVLNLCPHVRITGFSYANNDSRRFIMDFKWTSISQQPIVALEIVALKYDAFNRQLVGTLMFIPGTDSANWNPLQPGQSSADGTIGRSEESVMTAIAYVRNVRLADGSVWSVPTDVLLAELRKVSPRIRDFGELSPGTKPK